MSDSKEAIKALIKTCIIFNVFNIVMCIFDIRIISFAISYFMFSFLVVVLGITIFEGSDE